MLCAEFLPHAHRPRSGVPSIFSPFLNSTAVAVLDFVLGSAALAVSGFLLFTVRGRAIPAARWLAAALLAWGILQALAGFGVAGWPVVVAKLAAAVAACGTALTFARGHSQRAGTDALMGLGEDVARLRLLEAAVTAS